MNKYSTVEVYDDKGQVDTEAIVKGDKPAPTFGEELDSIDLQFLLPKEEINCKVNFVPMFFHTAQLRDKLLFLN